MPSMKDILDLAGKIRDPELRKKTVEMLKNPALSNRKMKAPSVPFDQAPASTNWHHVKTGGLLEHTLAVAKMCVSVAENLSDIYKAELDMDALIAGALLHDIGKVWGVRKIRSGWQPTSLSLDHTMLGTAELHARHFPEKVVHIVAAHFGDQGPTPPQSIEAYILHTIDNMDAVLNANVEESNMVKLILG